MFKLTKKNFLLGYAGVVVVLWLVKVIAAPSTVAGGDKDVEEEVLQREASPNHPAALADNGTLRTDTMPKALVDEGTPEGSSMQDSSSQCTTFNDSRPHPIRSVANYDTSFPDTNAVQLVAARQWGVSPVYDRSDAEARKRELVYIGSSPYYHVDPLHQSIPYLVPRAAVLLQDIGRALFDSLYVKGIPLPRFIVTSVLRTQTDVLRLRRFNGNATENSCHLYGTTFDICYNRYKTVSDPDGPQRREVRNDTLKYVLSEVLRDMREQGRCYIKYERKQGCFHATVR